MGVFWLDQEEKARDGTGPSILELFRFIAQEIEIGGRCGGAARRAIFPSSLQWGGGETVWERKNSSLGQWQWAGDTHKCFLYLRRRGLARHVWFPAPKRNPVLHAADALQPQSQPVASRVGKYVSCPNGKGGEQPQSRWGPSLLQGPQNLAKGGRWQEEGAASASGWVSSGRRYHLTSLKGRLANAMQPSQLGSRAVASKATMLCVKEDAREQGMVVPLRLPTPLRCHTGLQRISQPSLLPLPGRGATVAAQERSWSTAMELAQAFAWRAAAFPDGESGSGWKPLHLSPWILAPLQLWAPAAARPQHPRPGKGVQ
ncbi:uncharacterized protein PHA67_002680 [Liasis olivaceus]